MHEIFGRGYEGRVVGGVLLASETITGEWTTREAALAALAAGDTTRVVVPDGGRADVALRGGPGEDAVVVGPAQIAARLTGMAPREARCDDGRVRGLLAAEQLMPLAGDVHWRLADDGTPEAWMPVRPARRRAWSRRRACRH